ncbi:hypothetical protein NDU88_002009 [Pleurodeles waltl]|uniref:Uncharacterized protein n=1 Tax=Pleurodeles waltl TaxID=8319 RepID=A0AAV7P5M4_PLEWA|nr:hypothetical protein NDU88_002009 [Pleurodeles waltl]
MVMSWFSRGSGVPYEVWQKKLNTVHQLLQLGRKPRRYLIAAARQPCSKPSEHCRSPQRGAPSDKRMCRRARGLRGAWCGDLRAGLRDLAMMGRPVAIGGGLKQVGASGPSEG